MDTTLDTTGRGTRGKNEARRLRREGKVPAVVYGADYRQGLAVAVDPRAISRILHSDAGANTLVTLALPGGGSTRVLMKEFQLDPVTHELLHIDFYQVAMDRAITVTVPIVLKGEARGVKQQGGLLDFVHREIEIECLPGDIPEHVEVDVSDLMLGQSVRLRDIVTGTKWTAVSEPDIMLVHVVAPRAEEAAEPAEAAAAAPSAEPEVIKKGKAEKEEE